MANDVLFDRVPLDAAIARVEDEQARASSTEAKMARFASWRADLADLVADERMTLDEALAAMQERERKKQQIIDHGRQAADRIVGLPDRYRFAAGGSRSHLRRGAADLIVGPEPAVRRWPAAQ